MNPRRTAHRAIRLASTYLLVTTIGVSAVALSGSSADATTTQPYALLLSTGGNPSAMAYDTAGDLFVSFDNGPRLSGPHNIVEYAHTNQTTQTTYASDAVYPNPGGMTTSVAWDAATSSLLATVPTSIGSSTVFSAGSQTFSGFASIDNAQNVSVDSAGDVFVATGSDGTVEEYLNGSWTVLTPTFFNPVATLPDAHGNLFVANCEAGSSGGGISSVSGVGQVATTLTTAMKCPDGLALLPSGQLVVSDYSTGDIWRQTASGSFAIIATGLRTPEGLATDSHGDVDIANSGAGAIDVISNATFANEVAPTKGTTVVTSSSVVAHFTVSPFATATTCGLVVKGTSAVLRTSAVHAGACSFSGLSSNKGYVVKVTSTDAPFTPAALTISFTTKGPVKK